MAGLKRCLGVDLGSSRIKVAEMQAERAGLRLLRVLQAEVDIPQGTDEDERALRLTRALRDLLKSNKVTTRDAVFCVPGHAVFQRPVKLPKTSPERLRRIIEYEARQQIPFPLEQTRFEYQVFEDEENAEEVEVLLTAIKRDTIQSHVRLFRRTGLRIAGIGVSYFALFNYHLLDQGRISIGDKKAEKKSADGAKKAGKGFSFSFGKKKAKAAVVAADTADVAEEDAIPELDEDIPDFGPDGALEEIKAYVNLGANTMDLAIPKTGKMGPVGFCRTIPHAGNEMTKAIQAAMALDSFREAEEVKRTQAAVLSTMYDLEGGDEQNYSRKASEALTQVVDRRVIGELRRSLDFYISQPDGVAVDGLVLSGGQAATPYLASYVEEKLGVPVEILDALHNEKVAMAEGIDANDLCGGALAVGLALQGIGVAPIQIDFLPSELRTVREFKGRYRELAAMVAVLGGMIYFSSGIGEGKVQGYEQAAQALAAQHDPDAPAAVQQFNDIKTARQPVVDKLKGLVKVTDPRDLWLSFMAEVLAEKPSDVVLNVFQMNSDGAITISGECANLDPIMDFKDNLSKRTDLVSDFKSNVPFDPVPDPLNRFARGSYKFDFTMRHVRKYVSAVPTPTPTPTPVGATPR